MRATPFLVACVIAGLASGWTAEPVAAKVRVVPFGKVGSWSIRAVYGASGPFDHCSANASYQSGTRVSIIVYRSGNWRLWFSHDAWPDRGQNSFPARLEVDGRTVLNQSGSYKGRSAYLNLGSDVARVRALMRGRIMAIITPSGTSRFTLRGTNLATQTVARCWKAHNKVPSGGAFGSANNNATGGAFGSGAPGNSGSSIQLSRAGTLELATRYLSKSRQSYTILPAEKSVLKSYPVNWKMQDGSIGGMRVFKNTSVQVDKVLDVLLSNQAKNCKGRNASEREPAKVIKGRRLVRAKGVCETSKGKVLNVAYKVAEIGRRMVMMVMEVRSAGRSGPTKRSPGKDDAIFVPGPNEL